MSKASAIHKQWNLKTPIVALAANRDGDWIALALGDGALRLLPANAHAEDPRPTDLHNGVSLSLKADGDGHAFISGGDDGKLFIIDPQLAGAPTLLAEHKGQWIDHVATSVEGDRAYSVGKNVFRLDEEGKTLVSLAHPSSVGDLAFAPNGRRLAASHYNGLSLWWTNARDDVPVTLVWKGSHLGVIWHPESKMVLTSLQESALHGWRLSDNAEMQMQGYAAKIRSMAFTAKGRYLATSGAEQVICWPFFGGGPWNKTPLTLGPEGAGLVTRIAVHPKDDMLAAGYDNGMVVLAPLDGRAEMVILPPVGSENASVTGLVWNGAGDCLFAANENGYLFEFTIDSVRKSVAHG